MKIIEYIDTLNIIVEFQDSHKYKINTTVSNFKRGNIKNPYDISVSTMGYLGEGKYLSKNNDIVTPIYATWRNMLKRCYDESDRYLHPSYKKCEVFKEWHNFQNFAAWYEENFYQVGNERMHLDKDILYKGNKTYAPDRCIFVPQRISMIFMTKTRKDNLPNGITHNKASDTYVAYYNGIKYGKYKTLDDAVAEHNKQKRIHIKQVVKEYGNELPENVINALLSW